MIMDTRVGFGATSILEGMCLAYIISNTKDGKFKGDWNYIVSYDRLRKYNGNQKTHMVSDVTIEEGEE